jgi:hypothetical protein
MMLGSAASAWLHLFVLIAVLLTQNIPALAAKPVPTLRWDVISHNPPWGIVHALAEGPDGTIWIGTETGLFGWRGGQTLVSELNGAALTHRRVTTLARIGDAVWVGATDSLVSIERDDVKTIEVSKVGDAASHIEVTAICGAEREVMAGIEEVSPAGNSYRWGHVVAGRFVDLQGSSDLSDPITACATVRGTTLAAGAFGLKKREGERFVAVAAKGLGGGVLDLMVSGESLVALTPTGLRRAIIDTPPGAAWLPDGPPFPFDLPTFVARTSQGPVVTDTDGSAWLQFNGAWKNILNESHTIPSASGRPIETRQGVVLFGARDPPAFDVLVYRPNFLKPWLNALNLDPGPVTSLTLGTRRELCAVALDQGEHARWAGCVAPNDTWWGAGIDQGLPRDAERVATRDDEVWVASPRRIVALRRPKNPRDKPAVMPVDLTAAKLQANEIIGGMFGDGSGWIWIQIDLEQRHADGGTEILFQRGYAVDPNGDWHTLMPPIFQVNSSVIASDRSIWIATEDKVWRALSHEDAIRGRAIEVFGPRQNDLQFAMLAGNGTEIGVAEPTLGLSVFKPDGTLIATSQMADLWLTYDSIQAFSAGPQGHWWFARRLSVEDVSYPENKARAISNLWFNRDVHTRSLAAVSTGEAPNRYFIATEDGLFESRPDCRGFENAAPLVTATLGGQPLANGANLPWDSTVVTLRARFIDLIPESEVQPIKMEFGGVTRDLDIDQPLDVGIVPSGTTQVRVWYTAGGCSSPASLVSFTLAAAPLPRRWWFWPSVALTASSVLLFVLIRRSTIYSIRTRWLGERWMLVGRTPDIILEIEDASQNLIIRDLSPLRAGGISNELRFAYQRGTLVPPPELLLGLSTHLEGYRDGAPFELRLPTQLAGWKWEQYTPPNRPAGRWSLKRPMARVLSTDTWPETTKGGPTRRLVALVTDHGPSDEYEFKSAAAQVNLIGSFLRKIGAQVTVVSGKEVSKKRIVDALAQGVNIFHYAGHTADVQSEPHLRFGEEKLLISELTSVLGGKLIGFVFLNTCYAASDVNSAGPLAAITQPFLSSGGFVLAPTDLIDGDVSAHFALSVYKNLFPLLRGRDSIAIAEAIRLSRIRLAGSNLETDPYSSFGNPTSAFKLTKKWHSDGSDQTASRNNPKSQVSA